MSTTDTIITAFGESSIEITFYDNDQLSVDSQHIVGVKNGFYKWSINPVHFEEDIQKYGFSLKNNGYLKVLVNVDGTAHNLTEGVNTIAFDLLNRNTFLPTRTDAPPISGLEVLFCLSSPEI